VSEARRLKALEDENIRLKQMPISVWTRRHLQSMTSSCFALSHSTVPIVRQHLRASSRILSVKLLLLLLHALCLGHAQDVTRYDNTRDFEEVSERSPSTKSFSQRLVAATGRSDPSHSIAIVIGLSDYVGGWPPIEAPLHDALRVRDVLVKSGFDYVVLLTNKRATKERIRYYMENVLPQKLDPDDRFIFYYSGHGTQRKLFNAIRGYLPMLESRTKDFASMIGMDEIAQWSANVEQTRHSLFILDSCFSGLAGEQAKGDTYVKIYLNDLMKPGHFLMTAGTEGQESWANLRKWGGSLFTDAFLKGIAGAADSGNPEFPPDGIISLSKLYDYIRRRISQERVNTPRIDQTPLLSDLTPKSAGELFFLSDGQVTAKLSAPSNRLPQSLESKGYLIRGTDLSLTSPALTIDKLYANGVSDFPAWQFGKTLEELSAAKWDQLPIAGEFKRNHVRYLWINMKVAAPGLKEEGCISPTSYVVFLFESHKLFRISLRFFHEGACPSHSTWLTHFANSLGASIESDGQLRYFHVAGNRVEMIGITAPELTQIDIVSAGSASFMTAKETLDWVKETQHLQ